MSAMRTVTIGTCAIDKGVSPERKVSGVAEITIRVATDITSTVRRQTELNGLRGELARSRRLERLRIAARLNDSAVQDVVGAAFLLNNSGRRPVVPF